MKRKWFIPQQFVSCNNYQRIVDILQKYIFGGSKGLLDARYDQMITHLNHDHTSWGQSCACSQILSSKDVLLKVPINVFPAQSALSSFSNRSDFGHDLPYWIEVDKSVEKGRIMLVSQDPRRKNQNPGVITLSTPFGMHSLDYRGNRLMTQLVEQLLNRGYSVYLTDYYKLYFKTSHRPIVMGNEMNIIREEIAFFNPTKIVTLGKVAGDALQPLQPGIIKLWHPNARQKGVSKLNYYITNIIP